MASGVSTREVKNVTPGSPGVGKSNVSRLWQQVGSKFVSDFRDRDISKQNWVGLMLDGIHLSKDQLAVVALGITAEGFKVVLDFELGSSETAAEEVVGELEKFLKGKNAEALKSLHEAGEDLIALHCLDVPNTLHQIIVRVWGYVFGA